MIDVSSLGILREILESELELMRAWRNAPNVRANMYTRHEIGHSEHLEWWGRLKDRADQKYFMYEIKSIPCGIVAFNGIDLLNRHSQWAFYAAPTAARGTGSRMEFLALDFAFSALELNKLSCEVLAFNAPVIKLHQKFGFKVEGVLRQQHRVDNSFVDIYRLGILRSEWHDARPLMLEKLIPTTSA